MLIRPVFRLIPALILLICALAAKADDFTVVIDAGHGGKDHGAIGVKAREKDINLGVALKLGEMIKDNMKDVKVVYTRSKDKFVTLQGRADIANEANGDLFISIHTNSVDSKSRNRTTVRGASVYTLGLKRGEENLNVAKRENSVMMLEPDYTTTYRGFDPNSTESYIMFELSRDIHMDHSIKVANAIQNELVSTANRKDNSVRQALFWVLVQTSMPAILVELDFICNPSSEKFLSSAEGQKKLAKAIYNGFKKYKRSCDLEAQALKGTKNNGVKKYKASRKNRTLAQSPKRQDDATPAVAAVGKTSEKNSSTASIIYKIQFLTYNSRLPDGSKRFKGLSDVESYKDKGLYKYTCGSYSSRKEADRYLREVKKKFSDAFIVPTVDGKRITLDEEKTILSDRR